MKNLEVNAVVQQQVLIDPADVIKNLKERLGFCEGRDLFVAEINGLLIIGEDISYHGSPTYEYSELSNNPNWVSLYQSLKCVEDYLRNLDDPQWQRHVEIEDQIEINLDVMQAQNTLFLHDMPGGKRLCLMD